MTRTSRSLTTLSLLSLLVALAAATFTVVAPHGATAQSGDRALSIRFVGCPPGGDETGPPPGCDRTVDAPELAVLSVTSDVAIALNDLERTGDGAYVVPWSVLSGASWAAGEIGLVNFFPADYNYYTFDGVDTLGRWYAGVQPVEGQTRDITVSYWNGPNGLIMPAENTLVVNAYTCGDGIDPTVDASECAPATAALQDLYIGSPPLRNLDMADYLTRSGGTLVYAGLPAYTQAQVVAEHPLQGYASVHITGQAERIENGSATAFLLRGERRVIDVYYYAPNGSTAASAPTPAPGTGTLRLMLVGCPPGTTPHDDPGNCTDPVAAPDAATVTFPETGERIALTRFEQDQSGAYLITGIRSSVTITDVTSPDYERIASDADQINGLEVVYNVEAGDTRDGRLYYFNQD